MDKWKRGEVGDAMGLSWVSGRGVKVLLVVEDLDLVLIGA